MIPIGYAGSCFRFYDVTGTRIDQTSHMSFKESIIIRWYSSIIFYSNYSWDRWSSFLRIQKLVNFIIVHYRGIVSISLLFNSNFLMNLFEQSNRYWISSQIVLQFVSFTKKHPSWYPSLRRRFVFDYNHLDRNNKYFKITEGSVEKWSKRW